MLVRFPGIIPVLVGILVVSIAIAISAFNLSAWGTILGIIGAVILMFGISQVFAHALVDGMPTIAILAILFIPALLAIGEIAAFAGPAPNNPEGWGPAPAMATALIVVVSVIQGGFCIIHAAFLFMSRRYSGRLRGITNDGSGQNSSE